MDDAVNAIVTAGFGFETITIVQGFHQINDKLLKENRCLSHDFG